MARLSKQDAQGYVLVKVKDLQPGNIFREGVVHYTVREPPKPQAFSTHYMLMQVTSDAGIERQVRKAAESTALVLKRTLQPGQ